MLDLLSKQRFVHFSTFDLNFGIFHVVHLSNVFAEFAQYIMFQRQSCCHICDRCCWWCCCSWCSPYEYDDYFGMDLLPQQYSSNSTEQTTLNGTSLGHSVHSSMKMTVQISSAPDVLYLMKNDVPDDTISVRAR